MVNFFNSFLSYIVLMVVIVVVAAVAITIGISLRKKKDMQTAALETEGKTQDSK